MKLLILILGLASWLQKGSCKEVDESIDQTINNTNPDKDLYVIHATVYQVGILTNKTDNMTNGFNSTGNLESVTLFRTNGSNIDLSGIPPPLLTNVTAQSMVGVAPIPQDTTNQKATPTWADFAMQANPGAKENVDTANPNNSINGSVLKRSTRNLLLRLFRRDTSVNSAVKMINGTAVIPPEAGVQSIALPPLLSLNNNFSNIPVPIPNTSVVHYAKVNTLIQKP